MAESQGFASFTKKLQCVDDAEPARPDHGGVEAAGSRQQPDHPERALPIDETGRVDGRKTVG